MFPCHTQYDRSNCWARNTELAPQFREAVISGSIHLSDVFDLSFGKFCAALTLSLWLIIPAFGVKIVYVVLLRAKKMMCRITAKLVVAPMQYVLPIWNRSIGQGISKTMSASQIGSCPKLPISTAVGGCGPVPAIIGSALIDFCPKKVDSSGFRSSGFSRGLFGGILGHDICSFVACVQAGDC